MEGECHAPYRDEEMETQGYGSCCYKASVAESLTALFIIVVCVILSCTITQARLRPLTATWCTKTHEEAIISLGTGFNIIYSRSAVTVVMQKNN